MNTFQVLTDKFSIGLSLLCAIHCLVLPLMLALLPSLTILQLDNEMVHYWMLAAVFPISVYALTMGCKQHKNYRVFVLGGIGLAVLFMAVLLGEERIGEWGEKILTLFGATLVAIGHFLNFRLCQSHTDCACTGCESSTEL